MATKRLQMELVAAARSQQSQTFIRARPLESDILTFHYVLEGPKDTPYEGGFYHGQLKFPADCACAPYCGASRRRPARKARRAPVLCPHASPHPRHTRRPLQAALGAHDHAQWPLRGEHAPVPVHVRLPCVRGAFIFFPRRDE